MCLCGCTVCVYTYINISILNYKRIISCLAGGFSPIESSPNTNEHQKILKPQPRYVYPYPVHHDICLENVVIIIACPSQNHGSGEHDPAKENERHSELLQVHKSEETKCFKKKRVFVVRTLYIGVSLNSGTPKTPQNNHFQQENPWLLGTTILGNPHMYTTWTVDGATPMYWFIIGLSLSHLLGVVSFTSQQCTVILRTQKSIQYIPSGFSGKFDHSS